MKTKHYVILLGITMVMLIYFLFCYGFLNYVIKGHTKDQIDLYFQNQDVKWKYQKALPNNKNSFKILAINSEDHSITYEFIFDYQYALLSAKQK